ncbi:ABC transporter permease [Paenibacillus thalictri]|uniref:Sugar ABC transporter permease n=1 Tax=Paenibacillus thalictri TaxID=2527873 RepID=A0A4Q9DNN3_9BACL|nr:ABC transporter permease subunit [Paenibacillus thalictri]TBL75397.1 sugar ABC transporter permease [Paenibacillus thalictri]
MSRTKIKHTWPLHILLLPGIVMLFIFSYGPMVGFVIAFQEYYPTKGFFGSDWIGFDHFVYLTELPDIRDVVYNTLFISFVKIVTTLAASIVIALLLNELRLKLLKRYTETVLLFPHFVSWVIMSSVLIDVFGRQGVVNNIVAALGLERIFFLGDPPWFLAVLFTSNMWKECGYLIVIILAALTNIDAQLYESAMIDGATRWKQTMHVTIPGITPIVILLATLSLGNILSGGFDQIFTMYNPLVYSVSDIIDTYVYRLGILSAQYSLATAAGLFKSVIGFLLIWLSYRLAEKYANYRIF